LRLEKGTVVKRTSIAFAAATLIAGLRAALQWYKSSQVQPDPGWPKDTSGIPFEPVDQTLAQVGRTVAIGAAMRKAAALNASAALWTAASVVLATVATLFGSLS
jgi:hypothetical protein